MADVYEINQPGQPTISRMTAAARSGNILAIKAMVTTRRAQSDLPEAIGLAVQVAALNGHFEIVRYLIGLNKYRSSATAAEIGKIACAAAQNGHLAILRWLLEDSDLGVDLNANHYRVADAAARNGHLAIVRYIVEVSNQEIDHHRILNSACISGHLDIVRFIVEEAKKEIDLTGNGHYALNVAFVNKRSHILRYLALMGYGIAAKVGDDLPLLQCCEKQPTEIIRSVHRARRVLICLLNRKIHPDVIQLAGEDLPKEYEEFLGESARREDFLARIDKAPFTLKELIKKAGNPTLTLTGEPPCKQK